MSKQINSQDLIEEAKKYVGYEKDVKNKISYLTLKRPERMNAVNSGMRRLFGEYIFKANIDDEVKVLVIRGAGNDLGVGADLEELAHMFGTRDMSLLYEFGIDDPSVKYPPQASFRYSAQLADFFSTSTSGMRSLQEFKKISILEVKGYCYGWHFYLSGDADLVISSDDALFGHTAFRYAGWGPRLWTWVEMIGLRKFQEMLFTGRPFTAKEMFDCGYVNSVVPRDKLEAETQKYALACSRTRPVDTVVVQKTFMELYKQYRGERLGAMLTGLVEGTGRYMKADSAADVDLDEDALKSGINNVVKDFDMNYPPEWRMSRGNRRKP